MASLSDMLGKGWKFCRHITDLVYAQLPLFVMLVVYSTIPTYFDGPYTYKTYLVVVLPQAVLPAILLCKLASLRRWLWWTVFVLANLFFTVELGCFFCQHLRLRSMVAIMFMQTNVSESVEFIESAIGHIAKAVVVSALLISFFVIIKKKWDKYYREHPLSRRAPAALPGLLLIVLSVFSIFVYIRIVSYFREYYKRLEDMNTASTFIAYPYALVDSFFNPDMQGLDRLEATLDAIPVCEPASSDSISVVYVIGESFSRAKSSLSGYKMNVSPLLERESAEGNLFVFDNVISHSASTIDVYRAMLSTWDILGEGDFVDFPLLPAILKKNGFHVAYFDNQSVTTGTTGFDFGCSYFFSDKRIVEKSIDEFNTEKYDLDGDLVDNYQPALDKNRNITIYHLMDHHVLFSKRYPEEFSYFTAEDYPHGMYTEKQAAQVAHYDNATRYNDFVLSSVIDKLRDKVAIMVYAPDHGEQVYDYADEMGRDQRITAANIRVFYEVPVFVWVSDKFKERYPDKIDALKENAHKAIYNSDLPHTILDAADVVTPTYQQELSLFQTGPGRHQRFIKGVDYDAARDSIAAVKMRYE